MAEEYFRTVDFEDFPKENKTQKIDPKKVYQGAAPRSHLYFGGIDEETLRKSNDFKIKEYLKDLDEGRKNPRKEFTGEVGEIQKKINERLKQIKSVPNDIGKLNAANPDDDFRLDESDERAAHIVMGIEDDLGIEISDAETYNAVMNELVDRGYTRGQAADMIEVNIDDALMDRIRSEINDDMMRDDYYEDDAVGNRGNKTETAEPEKTKVTKGIVNFDNKDDFLEKNNWSKDFYWDGNDLIDRKTGRDVYTLPNAGAEVPVIANAITEYKGKQGPANINPRQVYENASSSAPVEKAQENDYGGLDEEHNRLYEEYMSIDRTQRNVSSVLDDQLRKGQIGRQEWWDRTNRANDYFNGQKKKTKAEMDSVYAKIKAIDDERNRKAEEAKKQKESEALTAKRNQVRAELEKRNGRKYSDDEWATIVELASQLR